MLTKEEVHEVCKTLKALDETFMYFEEIYAPYVWLCAKSIENLLQLKHIRSHLKNLAETDKKTFKVDTNGGQQSMTYISCDAFIRFMTMSRNPNSIELASRLNINVVTRYYTSFETDIIKCILTTFDGTIMIPQYRCLQYRIDLYFPEYCLALECDENRHNSESNQLLDIGRQKDIQQVLGCRFIRFQPQKRGFNLFELLNSIFIHLSVHPKQSVEST